MSEREVRRIGPDDWQAFRDIRMRSLAESPDAFGSTYEREAAYDEEEWRLRLVRGPRFLVLVDGGPVALGGGFPLESGEVMVFGMWTDPPHRRRGHAAAVLDAVVAWARDHRRPVVLHVNIANPAARTTYERYGFVPTGELEPLRPGSDQQIELMRLP